MGTQKKSARRFGPQADLCQKTEGCAPWNQHHQRVGEGIWFWRRQQHETFGMDHASAGAYYHKKTSYFSSRPRWGKKPEGNQSLSPRKMVSHSAKIRRHAPYKVGKNIYIIEKSWRETVRPDGGAVVGKGCQDQRASKLQTIMHRPRSFGDGPVTQSKGRETRRVGLAGGVIDGKGRGNDAPTTGKVRCDRIRRKSKRD